MKFWTIEYSFLCCTVIPCWLSILYSVVCICYSSWFPTPCGLIRHWIPEFRSWLGNKIEFKSNWFGLPWWLSEKESACQCRGHGFNSWSRKIPHTVGQLSPCASITELMLSNSRAAETEAMCRNYRSPCTLEPVFFNKRSHCNEKPKHSN